MVGRLSVNNGPPLKWQSKCGRYSVSISAACMAKTLQTARAHYPHEVGTSLVGHYSKDGFDAYVMDTAPLTPDSRGSPRFFHRGIGGLRRFYVRLRRRHRGKRHYVGEWHSHPGKPPIPSAIDDQSQASISASTETNCPESILVIVGGALLEEPELGVYVYSRRRGRVDLARLSSFGA